MVKCEREPVPVSNQEHVQLVMESINTNEAPVIGDNIRETLLLNKKELLKISEVFKDPEWELDETERLKLNACVPKAIC